MRPVFRQPTVECRGADGGMHRYPAVCQQIIQAVLPYIQERITGPAAALQQLRVRIIGISLHVGTVNISGRPGQCFLPYQENIGTAALVFAYQKPFRKQGRSQQAHCCQQSRQPVAETAFLAGRRIRFRLLRKQNDRRYKPAHKIRTGDADGGIGNKKGGKPDTAAAD